MTQRGAFQVISSVESITYGPVYGAWLVNGSTDTQNNAKLLSLETRKTQKNKDKDNETARSRKW